MAQSGKKLAEFKTWHKPNMETLQRTANRGSISTGFDIDNSVKFEIDNSESIVTTNQAAGNQKTWTWSGWLKRTELDDTQTIFGAGGTYVRFVAANTLNVQQSGTSLTTNQVFRDTSAWYHLVWILDTTQSTEADRSRIYINGSRITSFSSATYPSQNADLDVGGSGSSSNWLQLGRWYAGGRRFSGYMAEIHYLNGTVAEPTEFGEYDSDSGIWIPKQYTGGGYGTQGYYYKFDNASNLGEDSSGEGHDANSLNNITSADQATDTPTNNFCTLNQVMLTQANTVISQGATSLFSTGASGNTVVGTMGVSRGKWYWEFKHISAGGTAYWSAIGYTSSESTDSTQTAGGNSGYPSHVALLPNGGTFTNGTILGGKFNTFSPNDIAGVALDMDNGDMYLYKNGTIQNSGNPIFTSIGDFAMPVGSVYLNGCGGYFNFGGFTSYTPASPATDDNGYGTFEYAPPSGYYALCTKNLAEYG